MDKRSAYARLKELDREIVLIRDTIAVLAFDQETAMPPAALEERGQQLGYLASLAQEKSTAKELRDLVAFLEKEDLPVEQMALVRYHSRFLATEGCLSPDFVAAQADLTARAQGAWVQARKDNDFAAFAPYLEEIIDSVKAKAKLIKPTGDVYDTLLDLYEEGESADHIASVFDPLEKKIHELMDKIGDRKVEAGFLTEPYDKDALHDFCLSVIRKMGYNGERGMVSISAHPFTSYLGQDDIRITSRYTDPAIFDPVSSIVHECGHALYDMHASLNPAIRGTSIGYGTSMSLHESQSRFWENMLGRSLAFWKAVYPDLQRAVPSLASISLEGFYRAINRSESSAIRVNADELTYPLHIILRFRIERMLVNGELEVKDLPSVWNRMSREIIRWDVESDAEGCLQDGHWAGGLIGYFPSYALGSIAAAGFMKALEDSVGGKDALEARIAAGDWKVVTDFQNEKIWKYGSIYSFGETVRRVTGKDLDPDIYTSYLADKYSRLYNLK